MKSLLYFAIGQIGWFACVLGAAHEVPAAGCAVVAAFTLWHVATARRPLQELKLVAAVTALGAIWDSGLVATGWLGYPHRLEPLPVAPLWIVALWCLFSIQLNVVYTWLKPHLKVAAVFGAIAGPLSFRAGTYFDAVSLNRGWKTMLVLGVGWGLLLPTMVLLSRRWNGVSAPPG